MTAQERLGIRLKELRAKNPQLTASECHDLMLMSSACAVPNLDKAQELEQFHHEHRNGYH